MSRLIVLLLLALSVPGLAASPEEVIRTSLSAAIPGIPVNAIRSTPIPGMYEVLLGESETVYASADGKFIFSGDLFQASSKGLVNITEQNKGGQRRALLGKINRTDLITFKASGPERGQVYVFTDVDCGYCRKFHQEIPQLNEAGVTVYYLAFPRSGLTGETYRKMNAVWCAADRNKTLSDVKRGLVPPAAPAACQSPVAAEYQLGVKMGVSGTPAVFLSDGRQVGGYIPARKLLEELGLK